jgi:hypothetical protein
MIVWLSREQIEVTLALLVMGFAVGWFWVGTRKVTTEPY